VSFFPKNIKFTYKGGVLDMAKGRPSKPIHLVKGHRTKKEKEVREKNEKSLLSGASFKEWDEVKNNVDSHKEFTRLKKVFKAIKKDDALHESVINRFCLLYAECKEYETLKKSLLNDLKELAQQEMEYVDRIQIKGNIQDRIMACDKKIMDKRKMMLDIEKENIMTIASALRSIPKKPQEEEEKNPFDNILKISR
jgi:hypothetical protein